MNAHQKRFERQKRRERAHRIERQRRIDKDRCAELMVWADMAWRRDDVEDCLRWLEKALRIRPGYSEALEWSVEACVRLHRFEQAFNFYERLNEPPGWPPLTYLAAFAAFRLAKFDRCDEWLSEFLSEKIHKTEFPNVWREAQVLKRDAARLRRAMSPPVESKQTKLFTPKPTPIPQEPVLGNLALPVPAAPAATPPDLPAFPDFSAPPLELRFEAAPMHAEQPIVGPVAEVFLRRDYALLRLQKGFDELLSLGAVRDVEHFWYQLETVRRVLRDFRGRALLADEVGLGKTIEACFVLKEYAMRGLVRKALILTPSSLVAQWLDELRSKFGVMAVSPETGGYARDPDAFWLHHDVVVASLHLARQPANRERLQKIDYDMLIVDEAHYLKNRSTSAWQLANELNKRFLLLLSATPVGNNLAELYNLILLLRPGLLGTEAQFRRDYGSARSAAASRLKDPASREKLRGLLREVMVRNTRAHIDLKLPRRLAATETVQPGILEAEILGGISDLIRTRYDSAAPSQRLGLTMLQMQAGSSPSALRYGLREHVAADHDPAIHAIAEKLGSLGRSAKTDALLALARRSPEKKIIFTRFLPTLEELRSTFESEGFRVAVFHGGLSANDKEAAIAEFRDRAEILLSTESGGEGRNLQFCNTVINFDLPWNPVAIEQRVGRVHRIGQTREVYVFNFCLAGSIEEYVLKVLHDKINLFELVAGEIEMILGELDQERDFSSIVMDLWARSATGPERESAFDKFAEELMRAKSGYQQAHELDNAAFGEDYEA